MIKYVSNTGGGSPVDFEAAILNGFADDGGLYVPESLPQLSRDQLITWKNLSFKELAFEVCSLFIERSIVPAEDLKGIIENAYSTFEREDIIPIKKLRSIKDTFVMELFSGPTLSFKDIGQSFLINLLDYFLKRRRKRLSVIVATTGDTGPAAANFIAGKSTLDAWVLYPKGMITIEQERQMTTLLNTNIHPVGVTNCPEGGDDLDAVIHKLYANIPFKEKVNLTSVNSINWGRIMAQMIHYFYGYFQVVDNMGEPISMTVPSGGFGNLCAGGLARKMGLPIKFLIVANNKNEALYRIFNHGVVSKKPIYETVSSAIDILIPYNFWRYLYFCVGKDSSKIKEWKNEFEVNGEYQFDEETFNSFSKDFLSRGVTDELTLETIKNIFYSEGYLLDPHGSVALSAVHSLKSHLLDHKVIVHATAHPAKFPITIMKTLGVSKLPKEGTHPSIELAKKRCQKGYIVDHPNLEEALIHAMESYWNQTQGNAKLVSPLSGGSENSNYTLTSEKGKYVLSICEQKSELEAGHLAFLLEHLQKHEYNTSRIIRNRNNDPISLWKRKPVLLKSYIEGDIIKDLSPNLLKLIGIELAKLHQVPSPNYLPDKLNYGKESFNKIKLYAQGSEFDQWLENILDYISPYFDQDLPRSLIHGDVFWNNVIINEDDQSVVIMDFEEATFYYRVFDIGMTIIGTCAEDITINLEKAGHLLEGYQNVIQLSDVEINSLRAFTVYAGASMTFWRHMNFNYVKPDPKLFNHYSELKKLTDSVLANNEFIFTNLL